MRSVRSLLLVTSTILGFAALASPASAAFVPFTVTKTCPASLNPIPNAVPIICVISASSIPALVNAKIFYYGPLAPNATFNATFLGSRAVLVTTAGDTASGYCNVYRAAVREGMCAFHDGNGALAELQAVAKVTVDITTSPATWYWNGVEAHAGP